MSATKPAPAATPAITKFEKQDRPTLAGPFHLCDFSVNLTEYAFEFR